MDTNRFADLIAANVYSPEEVKKLQWKIECAARVEALINGTLEPNPDRKRGKKK